MDDQPGTSSSPPGTATGGCVAKGSRSEGTWGGAKPSRRGMEMEMEMEMEGTLEPNPGLEAPRKRQIGQTHQNETENQETLLQLQQNKKKNEGEPELLWKAL